MDNWISPYPDVVALHKQPMLRDRDGRAMEDRRSRARQAEASRVAELEQTRALDAAGSPAEIDVPLPSATPPGVALTF